MKRMLMLASVASMIDQFNMPNIKLLIDMGFRVDVACNFLAGNTCSEEKIKELIIELEKLDVKHYQIDFSRNVSDVKSNIAAYKQVKQLMIKNKYDFVHCHSPIGGAIARLVGRKTKTKVIYTAHGFHFYKGAPFKNWLIYFPIEWLLSFYTEILLTINTEDYTFACKRLHAKRVEYIPGVGVDLKSFECKQLDKEAKRKEMGVPAHTMLLFSVGELNENKNHETVIRAIKDMDVYYLIAGKGEKREELQKLIDELGKEEQIKLLGFRGDISELYAIADMFVFPSFREGLSVALMEAMASGLPCVVSQIRGNQDLIDEGGGAYFKAGSKEQCLGAVKYVMEANRESMKKHNKEKIFKFSVEVVMEKMCSIYEMDSLLKEE